MLKEIRNIKGKHSARCGAVKSPTEGNIFESESIKHRWKVYKRIWWERCQANLRGQQSDVLPTELREAMKVLKSKLIGANGILAELLTPGCEERCAWFLLSVTVFESRKFHLKIGKPVFSCLFSRKEIEKNAAIIGLSLLSFTLAKLYA